jgi:hypothetical protein
MKNKCKMKNGYVIMVTDNSGQRRSTSGRFFKKSQARKELKKMLSPAKTNRYGVKLTSYRDAQSGTGINNPRIAKRKLFC